MRVLFNILITGALIAVFAQCKIFGETAIATIGSKNSVVQTLPITWFNSTLPEYGWIAGYGGSTSLTIADAKSGAAKKILKAAFDDREYSGVIASLGTNISRNVLGQRKTGSVRFKVKGSMGGERFSIGITDESSEGNDNNITVKVLSEDFFDVTKDWQTIEIPLSQFPDWGEKWDQVKHILGYNEIQWSKISQLRFCTQKGDNAALTGPSRIATIYLDSLEIIGGSITPKAPRIKRWWKFTEPLIFPKTKGNQADETFFSWFDKSLPGIGAVYTYGGLTDFRIAKSGSHDDNAVFAAYLDNSEYSGITIYRGNAGAISLKPHRGQGALEFLVKGGKGGEKFSIGLLDDESDAPNRKVQSKVDISQYTTLTTQWQTVRIPFKDFADQGLWWEPDSKREIMGTIDWSRISELRFSIEKYDNSVSSAKNEPVRIYFSNMRFVKNMDNYFDKNIYWATFHSNAPDLAIEDFKNTQKNEHWKVNLDSASTASVSFSSSDNPAHEKASAMKVSYFLNHTVVVKFAFDTNDTLSDWSRHNALRMSIFSEGRTQPLKIVIVDKGQEAWSALFHADKGWNDVTIPFVKFERYLWWQPGDVASNGKLDLDKITSMEFRPSQGFLQEYFLVDDIRLVNIPSSELGAIKASSVRVNQAWYHPKSVKSFVVADSNAHSFALFNEAGSIVKTGNLVPEKRWDMSGEYLKSGDFTEVDKPGKYKLIIQESGDLATVFVGAKPLNEAFKASLKSFYFQRASMNLVSPFAAGWPRKGGHPDTACILSASTGKTGHLRSPGGWYDAGDYGKYVVNAGISAGTMLSLHECYPALAPDKFLELPESGNRVPDILSEIKYELDWLKTMQDRDGGVFFKIGPLVWDGFVMPIESTQPRYVMGKSTASSLDFAAIMAQAYRVFKIYDKTYATDCLKRSELAWQWARLHPSITEPAEVGGTGSYADNRFDDEFFWAACELLVSTGNGEYKKFVLAALPNCPMNGPAEWNSVASLGHYSLITGKNSLPNSTISAIKESIISLANQFCANADSNGYHIPSQDFRWGSNAIILNHAVTLCYAYQLTGASKYLDAVVSCADYIFGKNAMGYSMVTGFGTLSPKHPHHRIMESDAFELPFPGFLVGGPNASREDALQEGVEYPFKEPARSYIDNVDSYASNEVCINWNAPLVFVLGFLEAHWSEK